MGAAARWAPKRVLKPTGESDELPIYPADDDDVLVSVDKLVEAKWKGTLRVLDIEIPCYVLSNGQRVIGRTAATEALTGIKGGGAFEKYIGVVALRPFINLPDVQDRMVSFRLPEVDGLDRAVKGLPADLWIEGGCPGLRGIWGGGPSPEACRMVGLRVNDQVHPRRKGPP